MQKLCDPAARQAATAAHKSGKKYDPTREVCHRAAAENCAFVCVLLRACWCVPLKRIDCNSAMQVSDGAAAIACCVLPVLVGGPLVALKPGL